jgi:hypothetical protein
VRFQVLTAASIKMRTFWDIAPYNFVGVEGRFRGAYCLHHYHPDYRGSTHLWNVGLLRKYVALYPQRRSSSSLFCSPEPPLVTVVCRLNPINILTYIREICFNTTPSFTHKFLKWSSLQIVQLIWLPCLLHAFPSHKPWYDQADHF